MKLSMSFFSHFHSSDTQSDTQRIIRTVLVVVLFWSIAPFIVQEEVFAQSRRVPSRSVPRAVPRNATLPRGSSIQGSTALRTSENEAIRLLKMGNTYREARDYDLAQKYINQGIEAATLSGNRYWQATGYEYLGLTYRDMGDRPAALSALQRASDLFSEIIKSRSQNSSRASTKMLLDNMMRDDASRLQPMPTPTSPSSLRPRDIPQRPASTLANERELNAQLTARLASLESRMRSLDNATNSSLNPRNDALSSPTPGAGTASRSLTLPPPTSSNPPGAIARTMPPRPVGDKPQGEFAPYQTDKKPVPQQPRPVQQTPVKKDTVLPLPIFTLQVGVGTGYALNRPVMAVPPASSTAIPTQFTGGSPTFSFPLLSISGDFFLSPNFSLGLMYGYYPGRDSVFVTNTVSATGTVQRRDTSTLYTNYHLLTLRPSVHFVRNQNLDVYLGLSLGTMLNFQPLRLYAGLMAGLQYNFTRQFGLFLELSGGGHFTGTTTIGGNTVTPTDPGTIVTLQPGIINIGAYGRLGFAVNF